MHKNRNFSTETYKGTKRKSKEQIDVQVLCTDDDDR